MKLRTVRRLAPWAAVLGVAWWLAQDRSAVPAPLTTSATGAPPAGTPDREPEPPEDVPAAPPASERAAPETPPPSPESLPSPVESPAPIEAPPVEAPPVEALSVDAAEPVESPHPTAEDGWGRAEVKALAPQLSKRATRLANALAAVAPLPVPASRLAAELGAPREAIASYVAALNRTAATTRPNLPAPVQQQGGTPAKPRYALDSGFAAHWPPAEG